MNSIVVTSAALVDACNTAFAAADRKATTLGRDVAHSLLRGHSLPLAGDVDRALAIKADEFEAWSLLREAQSLAGAS